MSNLIETTYDDFNQHFTNVYSSLDNKGYVVDDFVIKDYLNLSGGIDFIAHNSINLIEKKINSGFGYKSTVQDNGVLLYETPYQNNQTASNTTPVFTSKHYWKYYETFYGSPYNITEIPLNYNPQLLYNPNQLNYFDSGYVTKCIKKKVELYNVPPQSLYLIHSKYTFFDFDELKYELYGSITKMNSGMIDFSLPYNKKTNSICLGKDNILYGGLQNDNYCHIKTYDIKNYLLYEKLHFSYFESRIPEISGSIISDYNGGYYANSHSITNYGYTSCDIKSNLTYIENPTFKISLPYTRHVNIQQSGQNKTNWNSQNIVSSYYSFSKDSLVNVDSFLDSGLIKGSLSLYYCFYTGVGSGWFDFYPNGLGEIYSGIYSYDNRGILPSGTPGKPGIKTIPLPISEKCNFAYNKNYFNFSLNIFDYMRYEYFGIDAYLNLVYPKKVYSSGYIILYPSSSLTDIESVLSTNSPYGVRITGENINHFTVYAKGDITPIELQNALNFSDFGYNFTKLDINVIENKLNSQIDTHGAINQSGGVIWSHNHGHELLKFNIFTTGIMTNSGLYERPNHHAEIYRVFYDDKIDKNYFTGNVIKNSPILKEYSHFTEHSGVNNYLRKPAECIYSTIDYYDDKYYNNTVPLDILVSNYQTGTGVLEPGVFNKKTLDYNQSLLSNLTCKTTLIPKSYLYFTGTYPNIPNNTLIYTQTVISGEL